MNQAYAISMDITKDGKIILAGEGLPNPLENSTEIIILKIDFFGNIIWQKIYSGTKIDYPIQLKKHLIMDIYLQELQILLGLDGIIC